MKKTPKYAQIEAELIAQIESGQLAPGAELPSESDLIECYGVSRVTVRRAIDELYHQGYVEKMQGKRACVKEKVKTSGIDFDFKLYGRNHPTGDDTIS